MKEIFHPMQVWHDFAQIPADLRSAVTMGNFDGVHRGHQEIIQQTVALALRHDLTSVAITFDPHPGQIHRPHTAPTLITGLTDRLDRLAQLGLDGTWVIPYSLEFAQQSAHEFVTKYIVETLGAKEVIVGGDTRFGKNNDGDLSTMMELGDTYGFRVHHLSDVRAQGMPRRWSSSWVRELLDDGDVATAATVLGRPHRMRGEVVHGFKRGREMGFPTANLAPESDGFIPADGIYAGWLIRHSGTDQEVKLPAAISVGTNPTFSGVTRQVEAHVLGRDDLELYGEQIVVEFIHRLRKTVKFSGMEQLIEQMRSDVINAAIALGAPAPSQ